MVYLVMISRMLYLGDYIVDFGEIITVVLHEVCLYLKLALVCLRFSHAGHIDSFAKV